MIRSKFRTTKYMNGSFFFKGQVYEWSRFRNTGLHILITITPKLPNPTPLPHGYLYNVLVHRDHENITRLVKLHVSYTAAVTAAAGSSPVCRLSDTLYTRQQRKKKKINRRQNIQCNIYISWEKEHNI